MSTKIYNAYKTTLNICELLDKFKILAVKAKKIQEEQYLESLYERVILTGDSEIVLHGNKFDYYQELFKQRHTDWRELQISQYRNPYIDFSLSCSVFPLKDKILLKFYGEYSMLDLIDEEDYLIDYHYQNQCDKPDSISDDDWEARRKTWNDILGYEKPRDVSFSFDFASNDDILTLSLYKRKPEYIPTIDERVKNLKKMQESIVGLPLKSDDELKSELPKIFDK